MAEGERGSEQEVLELSLKEFTRKVTRERMFLAKDVAHVSVEAREGVYVQMCGNLRGNWDPEFVRI